MGVIRGQTVQRPPQTKPIWPKLSHITGVEVMDLNRSKLARPREAFGIYSLVSIDTLKMYLIKTIWLLSGKNIPALASNPYARVEYCVCNIFVNSQIQLDLAFNVISQQVMMLAKQFDLR